MRVLITGSNGLLGQKLTNLLSQKKTLDVHASGRDSNRNVPSSYSYHSLNLAKSDELFSLFDELVPDVVIHAAAMTDIDRCEAEPEKSYLHNVQVVEYLVEACKKCDAFLTHLSTDFIFDGVSGPYDEESKTNPLNVYGQNKLEAEKIVLDSDIRAGIARTVLVYGQVYDMSRSNIVLWVKQSLEARKAISLVTDQRRMPTLAEDLAQGCWLIAKKKTCGIFNISGSDYLSPYEMALEIAEVFGLDSKLILPTDGSKFSQLAKRPPETELILNKARKILGYDPRSFRQGLELLKSQVS